MIDELGTSSIYRLVLGRAGTAVAPFGVRVYKLRRRLGLVDCYMVEGDFAGAISIGVEWLKTHGFRSTCAGELCHPVTPRRGPVKP